MKFYVHSLKILLYGRSGKMSFDISAGSSGLHPLLRIYKEIYIVDSKKKLILVRAIAQK